MRSLNKRGRPVKKQQPVIKKLTDEKWVAHFMKEFGAVKMQQVIQPDVSVKASENVQKISNDLTVATPVEVEIPAEKRPTYDVTSSVDKPLFAVKRRREKSPQACRDSKAKRQRRDD